MSGVALFEFDWFEDVEVIQWRMPAPLCRRCLNGEPGECQTPGCTFWTTPTSTTGALL